MQPIPIRFLREIGTVHRLRRYWEDNHTCNRWSYHNAFKELGRTYILDDYNSFGPESQYPTADYPTTCHYCGHETVLANGRLQLFRQRLYVALDGTEVPHDEMLPGDLFFQRAHAPAPGASYRHCHSGWTNCDGMHLHCVLPEGTTWDIDSRCNNCTLPNDTVHRCWIRHGDPERGFPSETDGTYQRSVIHVDKQGVTCAAGAGSIVVPGFHGFLHHGFITQC